MVSPILELTNINKSFGHVHANKNINLTINKGTIHGIIGENGAGKTTLIGLLTGSLPPSSGNAYIAGYNVLCSTFDAKRLIYIVQQYTLFLTRNQTTSVSLQYIT